MLKRGDVTLEDKSANKQVVFIRRRRKSFMAAVRDLSANTMDKSIIRQQAMDLF